MCDSYPWIDDVDGSVLVIIIMDPEALCSISSFSKRFSLMYLPFLKAASTCAA